MLSIQNTLGKIHLVHWMAFVLLNTIPLYVMLFPPTRRRRVALQVKYRSICFYSQGSQSNTFCTFTFILYYFLVNTIKSSVVTLCRNQREFTKYKYLNKTSKSCIHSRQYRFVLRQIKLSICTFTYVHISSKVSRCCPNKISWIWNLISLLFHIQHIFNEQ